MKKLLPLIGLLMLFMTILVFAQEVIDTPRKLDIYYFHGHRPAVPSAGPLRMKPGPCSAAISRKNWIPAS